MILFAGAGFSTDAKNRRNQPPPLTRGLCEALCDRCGWSYSGEDLGTVYDVAQKHLGIAGLTELLRLLYEDCTPATWQQQIAQLIWYRTYTTNIDDVLENSYRGACKQKLILRVSTDPVQDHDQWYETLQCVHLHGSIKRTDARFTFSQEDYADQTASSSPWYQALADDMQVKTVLFVGSQLNEPALYHYLRMRSKRDPGVSEPRAKAYLVIKSISPIKLRQLRGQNIVVFEVSAAEFFEQAAGEILSRVPDRIKLLENRYPHQIATLRAPQFSTQKELLRQFDLVSDLMQAQPSVSQRSGFYQGAEPTWSDIHGNLDAEREITGSLTEQLEQPVEGPRLLFVSGQAGSGKSTLLRRVAFELARRSQVVYFCKSVAAFDVEPLLDLLTHTQDHRLYIFVDNLQVHERSLSSLAKVFQATTQCTIVSADRPHIVHPRLRRFEPLEPTVVVMPLVNRPDCDNILDKLTDAGVLGVLTGLPRNRQRIEFLSRSRKQLLVALKEATSGKGFDIILRNEFESLAGHDAKLAYTITSLAYMHGAPVRRRHLVASLGGTDVQKARILNEDRREVIVGWGGGEEFFCPRHRVIAKQIATETADRQMRRVAVVTLLSRIRGDIYPESIRRRAPEYVAYRGIVNFDNLLDLFGEQADVIRAIYSELQDAYREDCLFWLQRGRSELYFDNFEFAENYLNASLSIRSEGNFQAYHHLGVLYLKRAATQEESSVAYEDLKAGEDILVVQIKERGREDAYPYAALVTYKLRFLQKKGSNSLNADLEQLKRIAEDGLRRHPYENAMKEAHEEILRAYLMLAVK